MRNVKKQNWIISANTKAYDHFASFDKNGYICWRQVNNFNEGDIVYIYCTKPYSRVIFKTIVESIDLKDIPYDKEFWVNKADYDNQTTKNYKFAKLKLLKAVDSPKLHLDELRNNGYPMKGGPQRGLRLDDQISDYLNECFEICNPIPDLAEEFRVSNLNNDNILNDLIKEGSVVKVYVNRYERSSIARNKCLEYYGNCCQICDFDFKSVYGDLGEGFIHVHHIVPLGEINAEYQVDYKKDLIPVCPNCHAMLHRKLNGNDISVEQLKAIVKKRKQY